MTKQVGNGLTYGSMPMPIYFGYLFGGWWTEKDGKGTRIESSSEVSITADVTLHAKWRPYAVGDIGPSGGYIFYDKGNYSGGWRYLEAAPVSTESASKLWGGGFFGTRVDGTGTGIGKGKSNTEKIVAKYGNTEPDGRKTDYAAKLCSDLVYGGYDDWFLPSKDELNQMVINLDKIGGFSDYYNTYWSSSEYSGINAWNQNFNGGGQYYHSKEYGYKVRPVRAF
jgi:hypothetical protein